jgi:hypothetical protein
MTSWVSYDPVYDAIGITPMCQLPFFRTYYIDLFTNVVHVDPIWFYAGQFIFMLWNAGNDPVLGWISDTSNCHQSVLNSVRRVYSSLCRILGRTSLIVPSADAKNADSVQGAPLSSRLRNFLSTHLRTCRRWVASARWHDPCGRSTVVCCIHISVVAVGHCASAPFLLARCIPLGVYVRAGVRAAFHQ